ncbi:MAG: glycosyltransferase [Tolypothrix sp. T3-bin4]|nr:glycosyltransferase [Tolypothrix sp. T3-bin4]
MPLISVIIPVYNGEITIQETIESVLNQTFTDFELIVIDDGSQDSTLQIVSTIQDPRIKVFSQPNAGVSTSRNRGLSHATGEFISFIDADDLWTPDKLETQLKALQENPKAAVAYSWTDYIDESSQPLQGSGYMSVNGDVYAKLLLIDFIGSGSNPLIRRYALTEVGGFDQSMTPSEDRDLWLRLAARYHFVAVPSPQILYRQSANSASTNILRMEKSSLRVIEQSFTQAPESLQHLKQSSLANNYKGLIFRALERSPGREGGLTAARLLWHSFRTDLSLLRARVIWKVLFKIAVMVLLPPKQAQALLTKMKYLSNINALHGYMQVEPSKLRKIS